MEKGKVHVKNEHRGVSAQTQQQQLTPKIAEGHPTTSLSPELKSAPFMGMHHNIEHPPQTVYYHPQRPSSKTNTTNISECETIGNSANDGVFPLCYVCGGNGGCESLRVRPNQDCPTEPYFPFLERHEPPNAVPKLTSTQTYVIACMLCYRSLREQWDAYERKKKPHLQRLYHMKRVDGKSYIGADIQTQGEYAAQMLGLSAEHLQHGNLHEDFAYLSGVPRTPNRADYERPSNVTNQYYSLQPNEPSLSVHYAQTNNTPSSTAQQYCDYYNRNFNATLNGQITPQPKEKQTGTTQLPKNVAHMNEEPAAVETRKSLGSGSPYDSLNIKSSSFAHHKFKLGQISSMNSASARNELNSSNETQKVLHTNPESKQQLQQQQRQDRNSPQYDYGIATGVVGVGVGGNHSNAASMADVIDDASGAALDLRNSSNNICEPYMLSCGTSRQMFRNASPSNNATNQVDVGILDLSMPDKNSLTEVCYVCGDEQRRGSLIELSTVRSKDGKGRHHPYFPIFNEQIPRPPRSRPKDPRGMIQACQLCYEHLIQQWNNYQTTQTPENERSYTLRKKPTSVTERTTFVCYTCGGDTPSSRLRLVYCCPNAEREPYYPFIKTMKAFKNASPISPQGMVQICSSCYEKHLYLAEGGNNTTMAAATSTGRISGGPADNNAAGSGVGGAAAIYSVDGDANLSNNNVIATSAEGAGRYTPSEKSLANSDSTSNVKFKPYEPISNSSPSTQRDFKFARQGDSRPNSPTSSSQGPGESERGQYPCYICKILCAANKMEWLSTSAEHMNSHAMHFPCLRSSSNNGRDNVSLSGNGNTANNNDNNNRVLACKDCVNYLARQWETMDAERVPLEHRRYNIPSPMITSSSPNGSRHGGLTITTPPSTPSVSSTPASTSIYCFLCGLHSDLTLARVLYASKEGSRPYFPHLLKHNSLPNAEQLRKDYSALVCTFCYHSMLNQWRKYEAQTPAIAPTERKYNWHDYICHLCGITTYRKRVRALPVNEFPFVKNRKNGDGLLLENGEYAVVCLDCYESLRQQASQHDRFGVPISRRGYNWVPQPPPPEDSPDVAVARLPCGERSDRFPINTTLRSISNKKIASPKHGEKTKDVPPKSGQKRPATSPAPPIPSPHHIQSPSTTPGAGNSSGGNAATQMTSNPAMLNHVMPPNQLSGLQAATLQQQQQQHQAHQQAVAAAAAAAQAQQQQMVGVPGALNAAQASARGPFASALRNLAKQADIKEEDDINVRVDRNERAVPLSAGSGGGGVSGGGGAVGVAAAVSVANTNVVNVSNTARSSMSNERLPPTGGGGQISSVDERIMAKKRAGSSPQPGEKIARMSSQQSVQMQPELLARSGFQPYRSDERLIHPAGAFPLEAYATFAGLPTMPPGPFLSPAGLPYSDQLYLDQRFQMLRAAGSHHTHPHALYPPMASPYASHLYSMIPGAALGLGSALHERMKLEEEHRARIAREEEREREIQREKEQREREREQREREQREKEQREREQREKEQREKEQKEKEARDRELREKEREARERERQILSASHHYTSQLYSPLGRNLLGPMMPHLGLGLRAPPGALHSLPMSAYHAASQRQSPHSAMGLNLGLPGLGSVPSLSHGPGGLPHHLQQSALGLAHPSAAGLTHPGFPGAALGLSHHGINLTHPHISPHHPAMVPSHQISPHSSSIASTSTTTTSPHNLNLSMQSNAGSSMKVSVPSSVSQTSVSGLQSSTSMTQATSTLSSHIPQMSNSLYHSHHSSQHLSSAGLAPTSAHQQPPTSMPLSLTSNSGRSHSASPITMKATSQLSNNNPGMHNQNGGRSASSPHTSRQLAMSQTQHQQNAGVHDKQNTLASSALEPATLDLTGSNSNSSVQVSSVASSGGGHNTHPNELNGGSGVETATIGERKESAATTAKNLSLNVSTTDKRSPSTSPTVAAKDNAAAYNMSVSNNAEDPTRQCSPNSAMSNAAEPHTSVSPPAKPTIGGDSIGVAGHGAGAGSGNYSNNSKVTAVPSDNNVKPTSDPSTGIFVPNTQNVPPNETVPPTVGATDVQTTATPNNTNNSSTSNHTHITSPTTTTPDACASVGGVTSTTGGSTSPPVVSSSTNIVNNKTQQKTNCDETVSSATPTTTTAAIEVNGGGAAAGGGR
nr:uncharacterized protein LOC106618749 isoform X1 [Bactrocera oleae]XP_036231297.1 uncharacterized protein LOC106618749 isoform X1 [Bactrocera oleae]XP_036231298.1 uncharacterized protein LOC106618749 isoform X1 [Bactrocera oleae]XP_036231299.1 uncharacterized protein LOC106618749 isoform X1 [Bactrocera oleae]XP_036231300.1 uncharacterized protein LOC106618749 isoform X1 [Bactrocera oleae]XP_036231301.1 uncharacterized protein LOC106618749 isoform X1 [Bactrocera oleae]XP_036231302.1 uncharac